MKISEDEKRLLITELANRLRDIVYARAEIVVKEQIEQILPQIGDDEPSSSKFRLKFTGEIVFR